MIIYINKIENRITFKLKTGYYLEHLMPGTMTLLGSTNKYLKERLLKMKIVKILLIFRLLK